MVKPAHQQFSDKLIRLVMWEAENAGFSHADLAETVGGSARTYENYKYGGTPTIAGLFGIIRTVKPQQVAKIIAEQCGGYYVSVSVGGGPSPDTMARHASSIMAETSDVVRAVADSLKDGVVSKPKRALIVREIDEAIEALLKTRIVLDEGSDR